MRLHTALLVLVTTLCTEFFFDVTSDPDDDGESDGGNDLFKALEVDEASVSGAG